MDLKRDTVNLYHGY